MNFLPLLSKELKELVRSLKLVFVPLVFIILGLGQPLVYKLMPTLLKSAGNMPEGAVINLPTPAPDQIVSAVFSQYNQMGIFVLVMVAMGAIAGERLSGVAATVLTKPVGRGEYLTAKAIAYGLLATVSLVLGIGLTAYYTQVLFGPVTWSAMTAATLLYLPNLLLAVAVTIGFSACMGSPLATGGASLAALIFLNVVPKYLGKFLASTYPGALSESAMKAATGVPYDVARPVLGVTVMLLLALTAGWAALRRQEI